MARGSSASAGNETEKAASHLDLPCPRGQSGSVRVNGVGWSLLSLCSPPQRHLYLGQVGLASSSGFPTTDHRAHR